MRKMIAAVAMGAALAASASAANADTAGFTLDITGSLNSGKMDQGVFTLKNLSAVAALTQIKIDFTPSTFNIDKVNGLTRKVDNGVDMAWNIASPDGSDGSIRADGFTINFTGFEAGDEASFNVEFDPDSTSGVVDLRTILFNNGASPNATLTVLFADGQSFSQVLGDEDPTKKAFHYEAQTAVSAVPEPATWAMMILGLGGVGAALRNRRRLVPVVAS